MFDLALEFQPVHADLPAYPAQLGPTVARTLRNRQIPDMQRARAELEAELANAEEALIAALDRHEARAEGRNRLQAFAAAQKQSGRAVPGSAINTKGTGR